MQYVNSLPVRFADVDHAGIVYYPRYFHYFHCAFEEFFEDTHGRPYVQWIEGQRLGFPTVHADADFRAPLRYGDALEIEVTIPRVGNSSSDWLFVARSGDRIAAQATITKACVDIDSLEPRPIPAELREHFARYRQAEPS